MKFSQTLLAVLLSISITSALPTEVGPIKDLLTTRATCAATCGTVCYYQTTIDAAVNEGYSDYKSGTEEGGSTYPHTYNNYEGFDFPVSGPYQEFPIMNNFKPYTGGSPGADRVIFNTGGKLAGVVTHTGASGNDFVACS